MREKNDRGASIFPHPALQDTDDADAMITEYGAYLPNHARLIRDRQPQVKWTFPITRRRYFSPAGFDLPVGNNWRNPAAAKHWPSS